MQHYPDLPGFVKQYLHCAREYEKIGHMLEKSLIGCIMPRLRLLKCCAGRFDIDVIVSPF